jgi:hypothetical protein
MSAAIGSDTCRALPGMASAVTMGHGLPAWPKGANDRIGGGRAVQNAELARSREELAQAQRAICAGERFSARRGSAAPALCEIRAPSVLRP